MEIDDTFAIFIMQLLILLGFALFAYFLKIEGRQTKLDLREASMDLNKRLQTFPAQLKKQIKASLDELDWSEVMAEVEMPESATPGTLGMILQAAPALWNLYQESKAHGLDLGELGQVAAKAGTEALHEELQEDEKQ